MQHKPNDCLDFGSLAELRARCELARQEARTLVGETQEILARSEAFGGYYET
jgi:hypothetical protein